MCSEPPRTKAGYNFERELVMPERRNRNAHDRTAEHTVGHTAENASAVGQRLARFMFDLQAETYDADEALRELAWADDRIRDFWLDQAGAVVSFLGLEGDNVRSCCRVGQRWR
jgi:hypothetical protein